MGIIKREEEVRWGGPAGRRGLTQWRRGFLSLVEGELSLFSSLVWVVFAFVGAKD
jgi:hypothetical protein